MPAHSESFTHPLRPYGWTRALEEQFEPQAGSGLVPARVARVDGPFCHAVAAARSDPSVRTIRADAGPVRDPDPVRCPTTGDWAAVDVRAGSGPRIVSLLPRSTVLIRGSASGRSLGQPLAANVDLVLITVSLAAKTDLARVERFLSIAWESGARPAVVLTKSDLPHDPGRVAAVAAAAPGAVVVVVSALTGEGLAELAALVEGATAVLLGQSGTGKSTLTNALAGSDVMVVEATRSRDEKGRHTTTVRELVPIPGGVLIDTPGLRGVGLYDSGEGLTAAFADVEALARDCRFRDCAHDSEPGCAVTAAIAAGALPQRRLASYRKLQRENEWMAARTDARLAAERLRKWKAISRQSGRARP